MMNEDELIKNGGGGVLRTIPIDLEKAWPELTNIGIDPTKRFDKRYIIRAILGKGQRGIVVGVEDYENGRSRWALKIILPCFSNDEDLHNRIFRSVNLCRNLKHKNIIAIGEHAKADNGLWYYKMEHVNGRNLLSMLHDENGAEFNFQQIIYVLREIACAMEYAHKAGVIHRDIKPSNIIIDNAGGVHLSDFSLARACDDGEGISKTGEFVSSPYYAAPEIFMGAPLDYRSDIYSFGILAFQLATGRCPFDDCDVVKLIHLHGHKELPKFYGKAKKYPGWFQKFVRKCAEKELKDRFASAAEIVKFLNMQIDKMNYRLILPQHNCRVAGLRCQMEDLQRQIDGKNRHIYRDIID